jgi:hypothetical protein
MSTDYELVPLPDMLKIYGSPLIRTEPSLDEAGYPDEQREANLYDPTTNVEEAQIPVPEVEQVQSEQRPEEHGSEHSTYRCVDQERSDTNEKKHERAKDA